MSRFGWLLFAVFLAPGAALAQEGWTCEPGYYGSDDGCDCGCGIVDPDCPSPSADVCEYWYCPLDAPVEADDNSQCVSEWTCAPENQGSGDGCDCGCGQADPDCPSANADVCERSACPEGTAPVVDDNSQCDLAGWTCSMTYYGVGDGCDCGCGIVDPDCESSVSECTYNNCPDGEAPAPDDNSQCVVVDRQPQTEECEVAAATWACWYPESGAPQYEPDGSCWDSAESAAECTEECRVDNEDFAALCAGGHHLACECTGEPFEGTGQSFECELAEAVALCLDPGHDSGPYGPDGSCWDDPDTAAFCSNDCAAGLEAHYNACQGGDEATCACLEEAPPDGEPVPQAEECASAIAVAECVGIPNIPYDLAGPEGACWLSEEAAASCVDDCIDMLALFATDCAGGGAASCECLGLASEGEGEGEEPGEGEGEPSEGEGENPGEGEGEPGEGEGEPGEGEGEEQDDEDDVEDALDEININCASQTSPTSLVPFGALALVLAGRRRRS